MPPRFSQAAVWELWRWIMGRIFFVEYYDVTVHLTSDLVDIKCHNVIILSY